MLVPACAALTAVSSSPDADWPPDVEASVAGINHALVGGLAVVGVYSFVRDGDGASRQYDTVLPRLASQLVRDSAFAARTRGDAQLDCAVAVSVSVKTPRYVWQLGWRDAMSRACELVSHKHGRAGAGSAQNAL